MTGDVARATAWLDRLAEAHEAATPGVWHVAPNGEIDAGNYDTVITGGPVDCMAYCYGGRSTLEGDNLTADAAAIVAEHNAMPALLALARGVAELAEELETSTYDSGTDHGYGYSDGLMDAAARLRALLADAAPDEEAR